MTEQRGPVTNAVIESAHIGFDRDVFLNPQLSFKLATGFHQCTPGYVLCEATGDSKKPRRPTAAFGIFVAELMAVAGVQRWSDMVGRTVRLVHDRPGMTGVIIGVGHIIEDRWFYFADAFAQESKASA